MPRTVLVVRFSAMGDVAIAASVMAGICAANPDVRFVIVTRRQWVPLFSGVHPDLIVHGVDLKAYPGPRGMWRLTSELCRQYRPDTLVDLHDVLRTKMMRCFARLRGLKVSVIDKGRADKRRLTRPHNKILRQLTPTADRYRSELVAVGLHDAMPASIPSDKRSEADSQTIRIGVAPFAAHQAKTYPPELTAQALELLCRHYGAALHILLFGGPGEVPQLEALADRLRSSGATVSDIAAEKRGLQAESDLISTLDLMIAMDSGNLHIAALRGVPSLSIWGGTHPFAGFSPVQCAPSVMLGADMECRPCSVFGNRPCSRTDSPYACLHAITPDRVAREAEQLISQSRP